MQILSYSSPRAGDLVPGALPAHRELIGHGGPDSAWRTVEKAKATIASGHYRRDGEIGGLRALPPEPSARHAVQARRQACELHRLCGGGAHGEAPRAHPGYRGQDHQIAEQTGYLDLTLFQLMCSKSILASLPPSFGRGEARKERRWAMGGFLSSIMERWGKFYRRSSIQVVLSLSLPWPW